MDCTYIEMAQASNSALRGANVSIRDDKIQIGPWAGVRCTLQTPNAEQTNRTHRRATVTTSNGASGCVLWIIIILNTKGIVHRESRRPDLFCRHYLIITLWQSCRRPQVSRLLHSTFNLINSSHTNYIRPRGFWCDMECSMNGPLSLIFYSQFLRRQKFFYRQVSMRFLEFIFRFSLSLFSVLFRCFFV